MIRRAYLWIGIALDSLQHRVFNSSRTPLCQFVDDHFHEYYNPDLCDEELK